MAHLELPRDFADLLSAFAAAEARYLVIGGYAVGIHDRPRTTKDLDVLLDPSPPNLARVQDALLDFGAPAAVAEEVVRAADDEIVWWGRAPMRIDFLKSAPGVVFEEAFSRRITVPIGEVTVQVIGLEDLIHAKRASGRDQDLVDARRLERRLRPGMR